jgi:hypothetical protein
MAQDQSLTLSAPSSRLLRFGRIFVAAAAIVGTTGITLMAAAAAAAAHRQYTDAQLPPTAFARRHWQSARSAVNAGRGAWQAEFTAPPTSQSGNGSRNGTKAGAHAAGQKHAVPA